MVPKIFITGATGYIGGDALYALYTKHPDYSYTALVRTPQKAEQVARAFPNVHFVIGDLDSADILEKEAERADVVIHTADASDHVGAAHAIARGLSRKTREHPGYWLHTGGTGILCWEDMKYDRLGAWSDKQYNDWTHVDELTHLPDEAFHRNVDKIVLEAGSKYADVVKTAIVCPPTIYGTGRGPGNQRSRQAYELAKLILTKGFIPVVGGGEARWNNVHVADLADLFVRLTEAAVEGNLDKELWGENGYLIVENGEHKWADLAREMGKKTVELGYVDRELEERGLAKEKALEQAGFEAVSWGLNSRGKAERARRVLGWTPSRPTIEQCVEEILRDEKARLG